MCKIKLFCLLLAIVMILGGCTNNTKEIEAAGTVDLEEDIISVLFHQPYLDAAGINVHHSRDRKAMPGKIAAVLNKEPVALTKETGGWFSNDYYAVTMKNSRITYYGDIKDNKPDGFGLLSAGEIDLNRPDTFSQVLYVGNFSKGRFDGYGAAFLGLYEKSQRTVEESTGLDSSYTATANIYLNAYVVYDGEWKKGEMNGEGNVFNSVGDPFAPIQANYWGGSNYPASIHVSGIKSEQYTGDTKEYHYGRLIYDGEMKYSCRQGKGTSYYDNGQEQYDGQWKGNKYNGSGKLYDENGVLVYSGKWKDGDYAS